MQPLLRSLVLGLGLVALPLHYAGAVDLDADMEDLTRAKVAKARAKFSVYGSQAGGDESANDCGSIDIGNVSGTRPGNSPKEIIVVVQGDVINTGNKCK